jgi:mercuric reductase
MMTDYDLIIIGGGAAAFAAANKANQLEEETLMINDSQDLPLGGTCVNVGCVPSKTLLHQGGENYYPKNSNFKAIDLEGNADLVEAINETNEMVEGFREGNYEKVVDKQDYVDLVDGRAKFKDENTVEVKEEAYTADKFLIATGASTFEPPIDGINEVDYLTNESVLELDYQPDKVVVIGGGPLGLEWSQIFHHFDTEVVVLERNDRFLKMEDSLISGEIEKHLSNEGIEMHSSAETQKVREENGQKIVETEINGEEQVFKADEILLATGIDPNTNDLNTEEAGIETDDRGFVEINERMETSQNHIYAAGDVTGELPLETVAAKQGNFATQNMFEDSTESEDSARSSEHESSPSVEKEINYDEIPHAVFTSPQVAAVGMTEQEYMEEYDTCLCSTVRMDQVEKAEAIKDTRGIARMVLDHETEEVLGFHIVGPMAADIITTATYAVKNQMTIDEIRDTVHIFPTLSEVVKKAAQSFDADLDEMACCVE